MPKNQNYISSELTHFVGRAKPTDDERFDLLNEIIKSGLLRGKIDNGKGSTIIQVDPNIDFSSNESFNVNMVCFCDIPTNDFEIHMNKYSHFGIAFSKDFLSRQGARPVYYIPHESTYVNNKISELFDRNVRILGDLKMRLLFESINKQMQGELDPNSELSHFLDMQLLSFIKFYDHSKDDDDIDNFYMEREWRTLERIEFSLEDIRRVILPAKYVKPFFKHFPEYNNHVTTI